MKLLSVVFAFAALIQAGWACLWDSDTLEFEARQLPDVIQTIAGRFDRNPPLYYEMRLARVQQQIRTNASDLALYDDAAVACDRLGRDAEAIKWMERKRKVLDSLPASASKSEHEYRYFANLGTFVAHKWFADGANRDHLAELEKAEKLIGKAIEINPDAHFGRELVQAKIIQWIIKGENYPLDVQDLKPLSHEQIRKGLCGLIVLGNAWESIDVFRALGQACWMDRSFGGDFGLSTVSGLCDLRIRELHGKGKKPLVEDSQLKDLLRDDTIIGSGLTWQQEDVKLNYANLRKNGDAYDAHRTEFMVTRLKQGRHPDTDESFWDGYEPVPPYKIPPKWIPLGGWIRAHLVIALALLCLFLGVGIPAIFFIVRAKIRRRRAAVTP